MSRHFVFQALRAIAASDDAACYELLIAEDGQDSCVGPLHEYAARGALACLGFTGVDIDRWIDRAPLVEHGAPALSTHAPSA